MTSVFFGFSFWILRKWDELFAAFAGLAPARGGRAVALAWKGLRPGAGCSVLMCGKPELLDRCCVHQTRGLSAFGSSRQHRDAVQALPRRHAWVVTGVLHTSPCGVRGRQSVAGESLRGRVAAVLIAVRVGSGRRGWVRPLFVGLGRDGLRSCLRGEEDDIRPRDGTAG